MSGASESTLEFQCPKCGKRLRAGASVAGKKLKCPACGTSVKVPGGSTSSGKDDDWLSLDTPSVPAAPTSPARSSASGATGTGSGSAKPKVTPPQNSAKKVSPSPQAPISQPTTSSPRTQSADPSPSKPKTTSNESRGVPGSPSTPSPGEHQKPGMQSPTSASDATPKFGSSLFDDDLPELAELEPKTPQGSSIPDILGIEGLDDLLPPIEGDHEAITLDAAKHALDDAPENQQYRVPCPTCRTPHYVVLSQKGTMVKCPDCYSEFKIPGPPPGWKPGKTPAKQNWGTNLASVSDHETQRENLRVKQKADELLSKAQTELADEEIEDLYTSDFDTKGFFQRTFGFVLDPIAVMQVMLYAVAFSGLLGVFEFGRQKILDTSVRENIGYAFISFISVPLLFVIIAFPLFSAAMAVLQAAANRQPKVKDWPGLNFLDDMGEIVVFISAFIASVLPGLFVGWLIGQSGGLGWMVSLSVTFTTFLFFPVLLLSMLDNGSPFQPFSISVFASLKEAAEAWGGYYMKTIVAYGSLLVASFLLHQMGPAGMAIYGFLIPWVIFFTCQQLGVVASQISEHLSVEFSKGDDESDESEETDSNQS